MNTQAQPREDAPLAAGRFGPLDPERLASSRPLLARYVRPLAARCGLSDLIEDLVQDALCRVLERELDAATSFQGCHTPQWRSYLKRIARSAVLDNLRRRTAGKRIQDDSFDRDPTVALAAPCPRPDALERLLARDRLRSFFVDCHRALPPRKSRNRDLSIARWAWGEGWSSREIACRLGGGLTAARIDSLLHRLRRRLRRLGIAAPTRVGLPETGERRR